jgi:perosamine synthetase
MVPHNRVILTAEDKAAVQRVLDSGQIGPGPEVEAFEHELAERFRPGGAAACVASGTAALRLALRWLGEWNISLPTYACTALYHAAFNSILDPVTLHDCEPGTFHSPKATVVVHTYGVPCAVPDDSIEDFTHAPGASFNGKPCGSMGALSVISFGATKPLGCGSGGAILGPKDAIEAIKDMRDYDGKRNLRERFNYAWHDLGAALGRSRLRLLDWDKQRRRFIAEAYTDGIAHPDRVKTWPKLVWYRYTIAVKDWRAAQMHFARCGVQTINPLEDWELLHRKLGLNPEDFPVAERLAATTLSLPIWPGMSAQEVATVKRALETL